MLIAFALCLVLAALVSVLALCFSFRRRQPSALEQLGVKPTYPRNCLPVATIDAYCSFKERLRRQYASNEAGNEWLAHLPLQVKEHLKFRLLQRAIAVVAALRRVAPDARGYAKLFTKGIVTQKFLNSVAEVENEITQELQNVTNEALDLEPKQDPQRIVSCAMHFINSNQSKIPQLDDVAANANALAELAAKLQEPGMGPRPGPPPQEPPPSGGNDGDGYIWHQDTDDVEVSVSVPNNTTKSEVVVVFQTSLLRVKHSGSVLVEGKLAKPIRPEGSTWTLGRGRIVVSLEKADAGSWPTLFQNT